MTNIIVVFPRMEEAKNIRNVLVRSGYGVACVCTTGSQALNFAGNLKDGIVVCGYQFADMIYEELLEYLSPAFEMLLVASPSRQVHTSSPNVICLSMPIKVHDLIGTLEMMSQKHGFRRKKKAKPKERSEEERSLLDQAKAVLIERNNMSESEAHSYIQKCSMDSGTDLIETAQMIISIMT